MKTYQLVLQGVIIVDFDHISYLSLQSLYKLINHGIFSGHCILEVE